MKYEIYDGDTLLNTIVADDDFVTEYCKKNGFTFKRIQEPAPDPEPTTEDRVAALEAENAAIKEQLQQADDTAIELYEANMAQEEISAAQDDALIEIYELIGG